MRLLNIFGNSIRKRLIAAVNLCCSFLWEDSLEWTDRCKWKEPSCCSSSTWENTQTWTNACTWALPPEQPEDLETSCFWDEGEDWIENEIWPNTILWDEQETWVQEDLWLACETYDGEDSPLWIQDEEWEDDEGWNNSPL